MNKVAIRFRFASGVTAFAARRNTPESAPHTIISAASNLRIEDNGRVQRIHIITPELRKHVNMMAKVVIAVR